MLVFAGDPYLLGHDTPYYPVKLPDPEDKGTKFL